MFTRLHELVNITNVKLERGLSMPAARLFADCILFDLDGTLYYSTAYVEYVENEIVRILQVMLGLDEASARSTLTERRSAIGTLTGALQSLGIDRQAFLETLAKKVNPSEYLSHDSRVSETLATLSQRGFRIGLVSNNGRTMVQKILAALGLAPSLFDVIVTANDAEPKPSSEPFLVALNALHFKAEEAVYVGDRPEPELAPARRLGIKTILLSRESTRANEWADIVINDLQSVLDVVQHTPV